MTLPLWADVLILCALPLIVLGAIWLLGDETPENGTVHAQEDGERDGGSEPDGEPPDSGEEDGRDDVLVAA